MSVGKSLVFFGSIAVVSRCFGASAPWPLFLDPSESVAAAINSESVVPVEFSQLCEKKYACRKMGDPAKDDAEASSPDDFFENKCNESVDQRVDGSFSEPGAAESALVLSCRADLAVGKDNALRRVAVVSGTTTITMFDPLGEAKIFNSDDLNHDGRNDLSLRISAEHSGVHYTVMHLLTMENKYLVPAGNSDRQVEWSDCTAQRDGKMIKAVVRVKDRGPKKWPKFESKYFQAACGNPTEWTALGSSKPKEFE